LLVLYIEFFLKNKSHKYIAQVIHNQLLVNPIFFIPY
jgi:hypothetical protein